MAIDTVINYVGQAVSQSEFQIMDKGLAVIAVLLKGNCANQYVMVVMAACHLLLDQKLDDELEPNMLW